MDMEKLMERVRQLAKETREDSNKVYPLFRNMHEGHSIIREELEEAEEMHNSVRRLFGYLWHSVREDNVEEAMEKAQWASERLEWEIAELIQSKAMFDKFVESRPAIEDFYKTAEERKNDDRN